MSSLSETYAAVLAVAAAIGGLITVIALRRSRSTGSIGLALASIATSIWCAAYSAEWLTPTLDGKLLIDNLLTLGAALVPSSLLIFAIQVSGRARWLSRPVLFLLAAPVVTQVLLAWTNPWLHLFHSSVDLTVNGSLTYLTFVDGPAYFVFADLYAYLLVLIAVLLLAVGLRSARGIYRVQYSLILVAVGIVVGSSLFTETGLSPWTQLDLAPLSLAIAGPVMAYALLRVGLLDLVPVARGVLVETMEDAVIVLDNRDRVVDLNPAAQRLLDLVGVPTIGVSAAVALGAFSDHFAQFDSDQPVRAEVLTDRAGWVDVRVVPLPDKPNRTSGRLIVVHDIQRLKEAEIGLRQANEQLRQQLSEIERLHAEVREQAIRDQLTGLVNRRFVAESLPRELARSERVGEPLSLVLFDIDNFKLINDRYGHQAGDAVLVGVANLLGTQARRGDLVCRHGGEEFLVVLPGVGSEAAWRRAERWRQAVETTTFPFADQTLSVTISAGISSYPDHAQTVQALIKEADEALYFAKAHGRNIVCLDRTRQAA